MDDTIHSLSTSGPEPLTDPQSRIQELEQSLKSAEIARDQAIQELDDVARFLSHDLRAPLRGIDGYSKALVEDYGGQLDNVALAYLQYINESGRLAAVVVDKLIQYIRTPRARMERVEVDLTDLAGELIERQQSHQPERRVIVEIAPGMTSQADPRLARLLLEYLLENAWKFSSKQPEARIEMRQLDESGAPIFMVCDNGAGFDPTYVGNLFKPFQRLHSAHEFEGAGMGLSVARRIVERHGGRIWAEGKVGQGARFYFTLESESSM